LQPSQAERYMIGTSKRRDSLQRAVGLFSSISPNVVGYDGSEISLMDICMQDNADVLLTIMTPHVSSYIPWAG